MAQKISELLSDLEMLTLAILVFAKESPYSKILDFVRNADLVVTFITHREEVYAKSIQFPTSHEQVLAKNKAMPTEHFAIVAKSDRSELLSFLKGQPQKKGRYYDCFEPHHFVYAKSGKKELRISICFTCDRLDVDGFYEYEANLRKGMTGQADKVFGLKFDPKKVGDPKPYVPEGNSVTRSGG